MPGECIAPSSLSPEASLPSVPGGDDDDARVHPPADGAAKGVVL